MFSGLIIFDLKLSFIVAENCPGAMTGDAKIFKEKYDGCIVKLGESPRRSRNSNSGQTELQINSPRSSQWFWKSLPNSNRPWHVLAKVASTTKFLLFLWPFIICNLLSAVSTLSFLDSINPAIHNCFLLFRSYS